MYRSAVCKCSVFIKNKQILCNKITPSSGRIVTAPCLIQPQPQQLLPVVVTTLLMSNKLLRLWPENPTSIWNCKYHIYLLCIYTYSLYLSTTYHYQLPNYLSTTYKLPIDLLSTTYELHMNYQSAIYQLNFNYISTIYQQPII